MSEHPLLEAALWYGCQGIAVFPLRPNDKRPATTRGFHDASTDIAVIGAWWAACPEYNIGLPTGGTFDVIDVDPPVGPDSLAELESAGLVPEVIARVATPRGEHVYIRATGDGCTTALRPGVDYRGRGGYVVGAPSVIEAGAWTITAANWEAISPNGHDPVSAVSFLAAVRAVFAPEASRKAYAPTAAPLGSPEDDPLAPSASWARTALRQEVARVAGAEKGSRNAALNRAAFSLAQIVAGGGLDHDEVVAALYRAAREAGLDEDETVATICSGMDAGEDSPRERPELALVVTEPAEAEEPANDDEVFLRETAHVLNWHEVAATPYSQEWIVEPILPAGRQVVIYSAPKVGKSLLLLELAAAVSTGRAVLGVKPSRRANVVYVDYENHPTADTWPRLNRMGYTVPAELDGLTVMSFATIAPLDTALGAAQLMRVVLLKSAEVVVIDTVSRAIRGEENENDTWLAFYRNTGMALKAAGVAMIRLDHSGKDEARGQRGGSAKSGDVDAVWRMSKIADETFRLECEAARLPIAEKTLVLYRRDDPLRHDVDPLGYIAAAQVAGAEAAKRGAELVVILDDLDVAPTASIRSAATALRSNGHGFRQNAAAWAQTFRKDRDDPFHD